MWPLKAMSVIPASVARSSFSAHTVFLCSSIFQTTQRAWQRMPAPQLQLQASSAVPLMGWGLRTSGCLHTHYVAEAVFEPLTFWIPLWSSGVSSTPLTHNAQLVCGIYIHVNHFSFFHLSVLPLLLPLTKWFPCCSILPYLN